MSVAGFLANGRAVDAWRSACDSIADGIVVVEQRAADAVGLADADIEVCPPATYGETIDDLLAPPADRAIVDDPVDAGSRRRTRTAADSDRHPGSGRSTTRAPERRGSPTSSSEPTPNDRTVPRRRRVPPSVGASATEVRRMPPQATAAALDRHRPAVDLPAGRPRRTAPAEPAARPPRRTTPSDGAARAATKETARRVASQLGGRAADASRRILESVPRPGPGAPEPLLGNASGSGTSRPSHDRPDNRDSHHRARPAAGEDRGGDWRSRLDDAGPTAGATDRRREAHANGVGERPELAPPGPSEEVAHARPSMSPVADGDRQAVRHVTEHGEQPTRLDRDRSTAPARVGDGIEPPARLVGFDLDVGDELERRMKQIIDDDARRHGIEV